MVFKLADRELSSRLIVGTGKFSSYAAMSDAISKSETEMVTVSIKQMNFTTKNVEDNIISFVNLDKVILLPNTAGAQTADEAITIAHICRDMGLSDWVKLEITTDAKYLLPDPIETLNAAKVLVKDGFKVMPYINADPILAKRLEELGTVSVMPLGSPIGSNQGLTTISALRIIIEMSNIPVIVDAGIGKPSDAARAMELGASAVLVNTAIAIAANPGIMAEAFKDAVRAGRKAFNAGLPRADFAASATSPHSTFLRELDV